MIPMDDILDVCINEGIRRWAVVGFLCVLRKGKDETVVVFPVSRSLDQSLVGHEVMMLTVSELRLRLQETHPQTTMLMEVYHGIREILWDEFDDEDDDEVQDLGLTEDTGNETRGGVR